MQDRLLLLRQLRAQRVTRIWLVTSGLVLLGLALAGGSMRLAQASGGNLFSADVFYEVMSVHGSGMVVVGLMAAAGVPWETVLMLELWSRRRTSQNKKAAAATSTQAALFQLQILCPSR